jgi:catechol 2,3-dioxygenase-like lactoylglutathione lyase family enzyme
MIKRLSVVTIWVRDQEEALDFYVNKLGFVKRQDIPMGPGARWLTVAPSEQHEVEITLLQPTAAWHGEEHLEEMLGRVGQSPTWSYITDDCQSSYEEYTARGVKFTSPPTAQMYGIEAVCEDLYGNGISILQPANVAEEPS